MTTERSGAEGLIRCPAVRGLVKTGQLAHENLETAAVEDLVHAFSGQPRNLKPDEPGSIGNIAGFFAIFNHGVPEHIFFRGMRNAIDGAKVAAGRPTARRFDLRLFESRGDHPGTVNFFKNDADGQFQSAQFEAEMQRVSDGTTLTIQGIAQLIIKANGGAWDKEGSTIDLAKSSGEWALMVCALRADPSTTDISVDHLRALYSQADTTQLHHGCSQASAHDWVKTTARIATAIAFEKGKDVAAIARGLHSAYGKINDGDGEKLCPCKRCNPAVYEQENPGS
jgi:hypothetical protein